MPSKYIVGEVTVHPEDVIFDYNDFYKIIYNFFKEKGYFVKEIEYHHNKKDDKINVGFYWDCVKNIDDYSQFKIEVFVDFPALKTITVIKEKIKQTSNKGSGSIKLRATLVTDYDAKWEQNPIFNFFKTIFEDYFYKSSVNKYMEELGQEMYDAENEVKGYFGMQRFM